MVYLLNMVIFQFAMSDCQMQRGSFFAELQGQPWHPWHGHFGSSDDISKLRTVPVGQFFEFGRPTQCFRTSNLDLL